MDKFLKAPATILALTREIEETHIVLLEQSETPHLFEIKFLFTKKIFLRLLWFVNFHMNDIDIVTPYFKIKNYCSQLELM